MEIKKSAFYENMKSNIGRRNFLSGLFLGILAFLITFLFKRDGGLMGLQKNLDTQSTDNMTHFINAANWD